MPCYTSQLMDKELVKPPKWMQDNIHYEVITGSVAYGVSSDTSDMDLVGWCIPPKELVFPHLSGEILGFGRQTKRFGEFQMHHVKDPDAMGGKGREYDLTIYSIVKYFQLLMQNNPNMVDTLFVPQNCVTHATKLGQMVRERRKMFLHKGSWHRFKGYAYQQMKRMNTKERTGKRKAVVEKFGFDVKHAYHIVRLMDEAEQILTTGDLDLQRAREQMKAVREGRMKKEDIVDLFTRKEKELEAVYHNSSLPHSPDEAKIKVLLMDCLEEHYGSLTGAFDVALVRSEKAAVVLDEIKAVMERHGI